MRVQKVGLYRRVEEYDYTPTADELFYYYRGTHGGINRDNPYAPRKARVTKVTLTEDSDA